MDTWIHGYMDTWIHGYMDTWTHTKKIQKSFFLHRNQPYKQTNKPCLHMRVKEYTNIDAYKNAGRPLVTLETMQIHVHVRCTSTNMGNYGLIKANPILSILFAWGLSIRVFTKQLCAGYSERRISMDISIPRAV